MSTETTAATPGQWAVGETYRTHDHPDRFWKTYISAKRPNDWPEMVGSSNGATKEEAQANARLIAAAPELYTALALYVEHYGDPLKVARKALQKATGSERDAFAEACFDLVERAALAPGDRKD